MHKRPLLRWRISVAHEGDRPHRGMVAESTSWKSELPRLSERHA